MHYVLLVTNSSIQLLAETSKLEKLVCNLKSHLFFNQHSIDVRTYSWLAMPQGGGFLVVSKIFTLTNLIQAKHRYS